MWFGQLATLALAHLLVRIMSTKLSQPSTTYSLCVVQKKSMILKDFSWHTHVTKIYYHSAPILDSASKSHSAVISHSALLISHNTLLTSHSVVHISHSALFILHSTPILHKHIVQLARSMKKNNKFANHKSKQRGHDWVFLILREQGLFPNLGLTSIYCRVYQILRR